MEDRRVPIVFGKPKKAEETRVMSLPDGRVFTVNGCLCELCLNGRWGRRIYGRITKDEEYMIFELWLTTRDGQNIQSRIRQTLVDIEKYPELYGNILNSMVDHIDRVLKDPESTKYTP